eukprot:1089103-Rhodomonas_salina.1
MSGVQSAWRAGCGEGGSCLCLCVCLFGEEPSTRLSFGEEALVDEQRGVAAGQIQTLHRYGHRVCGKRRNAWQPRGIGRSSTLHSSPSSPPSPPPPLPSTTLPFHSERTEEEDGGGEEEQRGWGRSAVLSPSTFPHPASRRQDCKPLAERCTGRYRVTRHCTVLP